MKKKFEIPVTRIGYAYKNIEVNANSQEEAEEIALDTAGDEEFSERESDYVLPESSKKFKVKVAKGVDACKPMEELDGKTKMSQVLEVLHEYSYCDDPSQVADEILSGIEEFEFDTEAEAKAFALGFRTIESYTQGYVLDASDEKVIEMLNEINE